jgi:hypothetical protein
LEDDSFPWSLGTWGFLDFDVFVLSPRAPRPFSVTLKGHGISYFWNFSFRFPAADGEKKGKKKEMFAISPKVFGIPVQEYRSTYLGVGENPGHSVGGCGLLVLCVKKNI